MSSANLTREETAARAAAITVKTIRVELDLTNARDHEDLGFPTTTTLEFDAQESETWLDFIGQSVESVTVNGIDRAVVWDGARIALTDLAEHNVVSIAAVGSYSRTGEGLHRFLDPADGQTYLYTQYEPADSRRVMACFEQPDMKARTTFVVAAPSSWQVLSNQSVVSMADDGAEKRVEFAPTLPLSSYITAVAAGPYHRVDSEWTRADLVVPLGVLCRESLAKNLDPDEILEITKQGLDFYADHFDFPYPWGKYDQIFVPEYNLGAMENPGLVTFTENYVFRGAATQAQREARANTILHEMAHMWFGDLVTMKWWDDLWLKESFADYMGSHASVAATRFTHEWVTFANSRKAWAYTQDQLPTTHPIVADIPDLEAAKLNFDGITYAKGAAVLKQLVAFVGEEQFFEGARRYFAAHAFANTTLDDLLVELEAASGKDVRAWSHAWLETTGMSTLSLETDSEGTWITQTDPRPHTLRVGIYRRDPSGVLRLLEKIPVDISDVRTPVKLPEADLVLVNDDDLTFAKVRLDPKSLHSVKQSLSTIEDDMPRGLIWSALWNAVRDGVLPVDTYLDVVRHHAQAETNVGVVGVVLRHALYAVCNFTRDPHTAKRQWLETTRKGAYEVEGDCQLVWVRAFAAAAEFSDAQAPLIRELLDGTSALPRIELDTDVRGRFVVALAATGYLSEEEIHAERQRDNTASGQANEVLALSARPIEEVRLQAWNSAWTSTTLSNELLSSTIAGFTAGARRDLTARMDSEYFKNIREVWRTRSIEMARRIVRDLYPAMETTELADRWLAENQDAPGALRRIVIEQTDNLARDLRVRAQG